MAAPSPIDRNDLGGPSGVPFGCLKLAVSTGAEGDPANAGAPLPSQDKRLSIGDERNDGGIAVEGELNDFFDPCASDHARLSLDAASRDTFLSRQARGSSGLTTIIAAFSANNFRCSGAHVALHVGHSAPASRGAEPSPGGTGRSLRSTHPAAPIDHFLSEFPERDRFHVPSLHEGLNTGASGGRSSGKVNEISTSGAVA